MSRTQEWRKCHICAEPVLWQTNGVGWHPIQYHDCKPVPLARLERAERERDEANAECREKQAIIERFMESEWQAVALLREAPDKDCDCEEGRVCGSCDYNRRKDAFLAERPAQTKPVVDDAMVEKAMVVYLCSGMRAALVAALEGKS